MLQGLTTISYWATDVTAAKDWYSELLGIEPYFNVPNTDGSLAYTEFRVGDYQHELGIIDRRFAPFDASVSAGVVAYWHVTDVEVTLEKLLAMGAKELEASKDRGQGFITASVVDPFGNILGIMYNLHYLKTLNEIKTMKGENK
jgi:predicted enzyme related to lactoylglutathione lyase